MRKSKYTERRIFLRRPYKTEVVFEDEFGDGLFYVHSRDLSLGGIFLASSIPVRVGTLLFLSFKIPPFKRPVKLTGEVVRVTESGQSGTQGMGIRFVGLTDIARERLDEFLSKSAKRSSGAFSFRTA